MNAYAITILVALLVSQALHLIGTALNIKALRSDLPEEFEGVYDAEKYRKSQEYTRVQTRFGVFGSTFDLLLTLGFWFAGGFPFIDRLARSWGEAWGVGSIGTGLLYMGILFVGKAIIDLPFSVYSTFVIEERFGFNKTTPRTFVTDRIKGLVLAILLGAPLLAALLYFLGETGAHAWLYCWLFTSGFSIVLSLVFPTWIMPLFNKFEPLEDGELKSTIFDYSRSVGFPLDKVFVIDGSKRSGKSNAFFSGFGKHKRLALFDTLIEKHPTKELVAVVAHEVGHYKKKHILKSMVIGIAHTGLLFYLLSIFITHPGLFEAFYMQETSVYAGLVFFGMLYTPIELLLSIALSAFSRKNEFEADRFAATTIGDPESMVGALKRLSADNLVNLTPHPFHVFLNASHPPMLERIRMIRGAMG